MDPSVKPTSVKKSTWFKPRYKDQHKTFIYIMLGCILFFVLCYIIRDLFKESFDQPNQLDNYFKKSPPSKTKVKGESRGETHARKLATKIFGKQFEKIRPDFLKNNVTGKNLELDIYNEELKLAIETDGQQHANYVPFFHKNYEHFLNQKYRDEIKNMLCEKNGVKLIRIDHKVSFDDYEHHIRVAARKLGYDV